MPGTERRLSTSSEDANALPQRQMSQDGSEIIPTRVSKVTTPKLASNPLQFIKTGPCDLYKAAQEQMKKVEEIKKVEKVKDDSEDWQSNLDNWKCSRRKRQEHIIERVVEVKKLELEEHDRNRRRSKTFNEMMEERNSKGGLRKMSILSFSEEDSNDLSDLGITSSKEKSAGDFASDQKQNGNHHANAGEGNNLNSSSNGHKRTISAYDNGSSTPATFSSPEPEEYTFERAIQGYMDFAEGKVKNPVKTTTTTTAAAAATATGEKGVNGSVNLRMCPRKVEPGGKIGEKLSELEQIRLRSKSTNDISGSGGGSSSSSSEAKQMPKVDVHKRRSLFEPNADATDTVGVIKSSDRFSKDLSNSKSIKERLSNLEKNKNNNGNNDAATKVNRSSPEVAPHIKDTISNLEKQKLEGNGPSGKKVPNGDVSPQISIKERLINLEKQNEDEGAGKCRASPDNVPSASIKERMFNFDASPSEKEGTAATTATPEKDPAFKEKLDTFKSTEKNHNEIVNSITLNSSNICSDSKENVRSLDRLDVSAGKEEKTEGSSDPAEIAPEYSSEKPNEPKSQTTLEEIQTKSPTIEAMTEPVSSFRLGEERKCKKSLVVVMVDERKEKHEPEPEVEPEPEPKPKETENETDYNNKVVAGETNNEMVKGHGQDGVLTTSAEELKLPSSPTKTMANTNNPVLTEVPDHQFDQSESLVTQIDLPDRSVPSCPHVNISVSFNSGPRDASHSCCVPEDEVDEAEASDKFPDRVTKYRDSQESIIAQLNSPRTRVRKLTPILTTPNIPTSPLKTVCELQIIEERECQEEMAEEKENCEKKSIAVHMTPGRIRSNLYDGRDSEVQAADVDTSVGNENDDFPNYMQEETTMYTEENIEEVLGKDDELETMVDDEEAQFDGGLAEEVKIQKELEAFTPKPREATEIMIPLKPEITDKPLPLFGDYENVFITNQVPQLCMSPDSDIYSTLTFPLGSRSSIEPPKEKPPPPPLDLSDDESAKPELPPKPSLRRLDSTKRIKKEIRKKRSDFLGIDGSVDDSYLEPEIYVAPPPDMMTFLQEERRLEQQLYRQSICSESDSNHETAESRDSGVELDRGHVDDICWSKPDVMSEPHSRQNSETFGNTSITSEEDEILKKEREIIEVLEKEEQWRYGNKNSHSAEQNDIGEKLAVKLRQLEQEKMQLERERAEEEDRRKAEESARRQNEQRLIAKQQQLRQQENCSPLSNMDSPIEQEALRFERKRLHKEHEHLERCRQNLMEQQNSEAVDVHYPGNSIGTHWDTPSNRHSLQEVPIGVSMVDVPRHSMQDVSQPQPQYQSQMTSGYRFSLPDLQQREPRAVRPPPPPPVPPAKPMRPLTQEQWERETNIRNSRIPSADNIPMQIEASTKLRHGSSVPAINVNHGGQQMTRSTLQALSAAPRSRIISNENWMQPKRKADVPKSNYNYQHWLIQEAEHRRILEHQQKVSQQLQAKRTLPYSGQSPAPYGGSPPSHHTVGLPISPSGQPGQQQNQKWISPLRGDKPLPDSVIQTLTQRVQGRENKTPPRRRMESSAPSLSSKSSSSSQQNHTSVNSSGQPQERMPSVSGKKKCSHCKEELGRGAAMIIESLRLFYHIDCFKCCVCHVQLGDGLMGTDVRVRNNKLHCHNCYSSDDGVKFSCV